MVFKVNVFSSISVWRSKSLQKNNEILKATQWLLLRKSLEAEAFVHCPLPASQDEGTRHRSIPHPAQHPRVCMGVPAFGSSRVSPPEKADVPRQAAVCFPLVPNKYTFDRHQTEKWLK